MPLSNCNCPSCQIAVATMQMDCIGTDTVEQAAAKRAAYEEGRRLYRVHNPHVTKDEIAEKEDRL